MGLDWHSSDCPVCAKLARVFPLAVLEVKMNKNYMHNGYRVSVKV